MKKLLPLLAMFSILLSNQLFAQTNSKQWITSSPDDSLRFIVTNNNGNLFYSVLLQSDTVIKTSALGVTTNGQSFTSGLTFKDQSTKKIDENYIMVTGKRKLNHNLANETTLSFINNNNIPIQLIVRAYNDGVAFKYAFPGNKTITVNDESTSFHIPADGVAWLQTFEFNPAYEGWFTFGSPIGENAKDSSGWSFPALFNSNDKWILITESNVTSDFYGSHLQQDCSNCIYKIAKPLKGEALGMYPVTATAKEPFSTPWRTVIIGKSLGTIVESNLVHDLADPNKLGDVSWVKPGKASWSWWSDHASSKDYNKLKEFVDLAKEMGWQYSLVDANWNIMKNGTIEQLAQYAKQQNIGLSLWYNSGGPHNDVTEQPRNIMNDPLKRKEEFKKLHDWGVKAVKIDFFQSDKQAIMKLYHDILEDAAAEKIMVVFHGCTLPKGWSRTYPNLMSMEAVKGAEQYGWDSSFANAAPKQNIVLMCTRNVVGPMDYTPVTFTSYECCKHVTSNAYELALTVLFESGILHFADRVSAYENLDDKIKAFMKAVPVAWDDTKFLDGYPGKLMLMARRKNNDWYVAGANGEAMEKTVTPDLSFLPKGSYSVMILKDGSSPDDIDVQEINYSAGDSLSIKMLPNGGFTLWFRKK